MSLLELQQEVAALKENLEAAGILLPEDSNVLRRHRLIGEFVHALEDATQRRINRGRIGLVDRAIALLGRSLSNRRSDGS